MSSAAADSPDVSRHAGQVVRRVLIRRNIAVGEEVVAFVRPAWTRRSPPPSSPSTPGSTWPPTSTAQITIVPAVPLTSAGKLDRKKLRTWTG